MSIAMLFAALVLCGVICFIWYYLAVLHPRKNTLDWIPLQEKTPLTLSLKRHPMTRRDLLPMLLLTAVYAFTAFFQLGSFTNPQSVISLGEGTPLVVELTDEVWVDKLAYYSGLGTGSYNLEISADGERWLTLWERKDAEGAVKGHYWAQSDGYAAPYHLPQSYDRLYKWISIAPENPQSARFIRITGRGEKALLELGELAFYTGTTQAAVTPTQDTPLFDEQATVPAEISWYNSSYFDEIYHARTAQEHLQGVYPYETSHPPLGKLILSLGVMLFGMVPFGWRFMGAAFGVLMVPLLYVFLKNLFGKTNLALCGAALFAFDFMHLTQTRIATIDTYGVFFILLSFYFLYRWFAADGTTPGKPASGGTLFLFLCGVSFGLGCASKWTVVYAGCGLAVLYCIHVVLRLRAWPEEADAPSRVGWLTRTVGLSILFFLVIGGGIYLLSYLPYAYADGNFTPQGLWNAMVNNQTLMFGYHKGVNDFHPYSSRWYQWLVDARPILYYLNSDPVTGLKSAFGAFNNPIVAWGGLLSMVVVAVRTVQRRCGKGLLIVVGYLAQLVPWVIIGRTTFAYHYFPSVIFLVLALCYLMNDLMMCERAKWRLPVYAMTGGAVALYALFYPVLIGLFVPTWYTTNILKWLPSWPF